MSDAGRQPRHRWLLTLVVTSLLSALILFAVGPAATPATALGATVFKATACNVNLRSGATAASRVRALVPAATRVTVTATVSGGAWRTTCTGKIAAGRTWYRISAVNGTSVKSLYGVSYVYAPTGTFKAATVTRYVACSTKLRTRPTTGAPSRVSVAVNTKVTVVAKVTGTHWSRTCLGRAVAGSAWYRISAVNGKSVKALYGASYVYGLVGAFRTAPTATAAAIKPAPPAPAGTGRSVRVSSVAGLLSALANDANGEIVVANGTYHVSPANSQRADSLYIGARYAGRTRPISVRAETRGGVTFDGGGRSSYGGLTFVNGAHNQTWDGFNFANMVAVDTGIIVFGGDPTLRPPHHITLRSVTLKSTLRRPSASDVNAHGVYFAQALGTGPHDLLVEDLSIDGTNALGLWSGVHAYHGGATHPPSYNVTIRRLKVTGTLFPIVLWEDSAIQHDWLVDGASLKGARSYAIRFESVGARNIAFRAVTSTLSGMGGFYSSMGAHPPGVTFTNDSLH